MRIEAVDRAQGLNFGKLKVARGALRRASDTLRGEPDGLKASFLTDSYNRFHDYLRISLTERCNLRCTYCMPAEGVSLTPHSKLLDANDLELVARLLVKNGVTKIRLTGGEPTIRKDFLKIAERLANLRQVGLQTLALTTNGMVLKRFLPELIALGVREFNVSLDTLCPEKFQRITRRNGFHKVIESLDAILSFQLSPKINVVVTRGVNDSEVVQFVDLTRHLPIKVRFIEYMPFGGNSWSQYMTVSAEEMYAKLESSFTEPITAVARKSGDTSDMFVLGDSPGSFGFISSMTNHFCHDCNRLRLTADGKLKTCLFGTDELDLRSYMPVRDQELDEEQLLRVISRQLSRKRAQHLEGKELVRSSVRPMVLIGG